MKTRHVAVCFALPIVLVLTLVGFPTLALEPHQEKTSLQEREFFRDELYISTSNVRIDLSAVRQRAGDDVVQRFVDERGTDFHLFMDPRSGALTNLIGAVPMISATASNEDPQVVGGLVREFILRHSNLIGIDPGQLGPTRARAVGAHLWQISIPQVVNGVPVRHGRIAATINHGNMVLLGTESWGDAAIDTRPAIDGDRAMELGFEQIGGRAAEDELWQKPNLEIVLFAPPEHQSGDAFVGPIGQGYGHRLVWSFGFYRPPSMGRWELLVDARSGEVISFQDTNHYDSEQMIGGVYPLTSTEICPTNETCGTMQSGSPMPFADTGLAPPDDYTNSAGLYNYTDGTATTTLDGLYVRVGDSCGSTSESTTEGPLDLGGINGDHDCTSSGASAGNTPASRSCFYELNKLIEQAKGWIPETPWLYSQLPANVNISSTCNANYDYVAVNFFKSGGGCRNTGEIAAVFDHEWGHGMDDNDAIGSMSSPSEAYADITAIYRLQASCVGYGFWHTNDRGCGMTSDGTGFNANESRTGTHCALDCSGVRDADWEKHEDGVPDTPQNFLCVHCDGGSGPCGKQVHCSAAPSRQAAWDFVARDLQAPPFNLDRTSAFIVGNKLFYQGSGNIGAWHACTCPDSSNGCGATNAYMQWLAADDDNGNLNDGTPHMTALFAAFDRHNIACDSPAPVNSGCANGPTEAPSLSVETGSNQLGLQWDAVPGVLQYRVFRTEGYAGCDFGKTLIATVNGTSYTDSDVANDRPYSYVVQAVGSSDACFGPASNCETATPLPCAGSVDLDGSIYNCSQEVGITLVDSDLVLGGTHDVAVHSESEPTPETVTLVESPPASGNFVGTFLTTGEPAAAGDGMLSVADGDTITVTYTDASFCGTPDVTIERSAGVDCVAPQILDIDVSDVTGHSAVVTWSTDEPADSVVTYGEELPPDAGSVSDPNPTTSHLVQLTGLAECSAYWFSVQSTDLASNTGTDDNAGDFYAFETFKNSNPTYPTQDPPVPIPDNNPAGATSTITVTDREPVLDVNVIVNITHTFDGDLELSLIGPDNTTVILSDRRGGSGNDFIDTVFDDEADLPISDGSPPFTGSFRPDQPLSAFDGLQAEGVWTLRVEDMAGADTGSIESWSIELTYEAQACGPHLRYDSHTLADTCNGVGGGGYNGIVDPGEDIALPVMLRNNGTDLTSGITATLATTTPGVTVTRAVASYPDLEAGESALSTSFPFEFTVDMDVPCGTSIEFHVETVANEGVWSDDFTVQVGSAGPQCDSCWVLAPGQVPWLAWTEGGTTGLQWGSVPGARFYNVYQGGEDDLPRLMDGSVDSCRRVTTMIDHTGETLTEIPAPGSVYWYLVRAGSAGGEGPAGDSSDGPREQNSSGDCP